MGAYREKDKVVKKNVTEDRRIWMVEKAEHRKQLKTRDKSFTIL